MAETAIKSTSAQITRGADQISFEMLFGLQSILATILYPPFYLLYLPVRFGYYTSVTLHTCTQSDVVHIQE